MKKIFIAIPRNKSPEQIAVDQDILKKLARIYINDDVTEITHYEDENVNADFQSMIVFAENIKSISEADYLICGEGYEIDKFCKLYYYVAKKFWKKILIEDGKTLKGV